MMYVEIIRSNRKTVSIEIKPDLQVIVRAPLNISDKEIDNIIRKKSPWIRKHLYQNQIRKEEKLNNKVPSFTAEEISKLTAEAKKLLPLRVDYFAKTIGVTYNKISVKHQVSRWGSCSSKKNLNFNCLLMLCPQNVQDYVIIHELCHLKELNHSPKFWAEVEKYCKNYDECRNWLKNEGIKLIDRLR